MGLMVVCTMDVGAVAMVASDAMGPFERSDGWAKISYFVAYGGSSVDSWCEEYVCEPVESGTLVPDSAAANSHLPIDMAVLGVDDEERTE